MSLHASEFCAVIVGDVYGDLASLLFKILLRHGRLSLPALRHHTSLAPRMVKHGLSVLIQQLLVLWYTADKNVTTYEANPEFAYMLVRSGKYMKIVEERMSKLAGQVVFNLLTLGHTRVEEYVQQYTTPNGRSSTNKSISTGKSNKSQLNTSDLTEDHNAGGPATPDSIREILYDLFQRGFVSKVNISHFRSDQDNRIEAEKVVPPVEYYKAKSKRENEAQWEASVAKKLAEWKNDTGDGTSEINGIDKGSKRMQEDPVDSKPGKRPRLDFQSTKSDVAVPEPVYNSWAGASGCFPDITILQINHAKFAAIMRNDFLIRMAAQSICTGTSNVYAEVLHVLEARLSMCRSEGVMLSDPEEDRDLSTLQQISTENIVPRIEDTAELVSALGNVQDSMIEIEHPKKRRKKEFSDEDESSPDEDESDRSSEMDDDSAVSSDSDQVNGDEEKDPHRETVRNHLLLLARHPHKFLHHFPQTHMLPERWTVDFPTLMRNITHHTMMQTIGRRHGVLARRITQILSDNGKLGEKELTNLTMANQKTMRGQIAILHNAGMIHLQEVPRDGSRNPARTMYLWFFDVERARAILQDESCKAMARCLQRVSIEREKVRGVVEKASRSDVIGKEEKFLSVQEREALDKWRAVEARIWGQVGRMDDVVGIMRDY